jgi:formylglycine-generating enzyme required for sulfatase activity
MTKKPMDNFRLLTDEPILESDRTDLLQFEHTAKVLARATLQTYSPITIGVFGDWGSGKTSLMRLMKQVVERDGEDTAVAVWFNAWQYEREEHLIVPLIATIARDIKKRQGKWSKVLKDGGKKVHDALRSVLYGVAMKGKLGVPLLGELEISASMQTTSGYYSQKITLLKEKLKAETSPTMNSLIEILNKNEHLFNVLNSSSGQSWLASREFREELQKAYEDKEATAEIPATRDKAGRVSARPRSPKEPAEDGAEIIPGLRIVDVPAGEFQMGSEDGSERERPLHSVNLDAFRMSATLVTQAQYEAVMGVNPSHFKGKENSNRPAENVSWDDAMVFCERLTKLAKGKYRVTLPTEAQWEYAARGGNRSKGYQFSGGDDPDEVGWYDENSSGSTQPVATKKANELGLYDMSGNVWEWCQDKWHDHYNGAPTDGSAWETGDSSDRGGVGFRLVFVP